MIPSIVNTAKNEITMTSKQIEEVIKSIPDVKDKRHDHIIRDIEKMFEKLGHPKSELALKTSTYKDAQEKDRKMYLLNEDEVMCLVAGYSTKIRMTLIKEFRKLKEQLNKPMSQLEIVVANSQALLAQEQKLTALESRVKHIELNLDNTTEYFTALAFCKLNSSQSQ